MRDETAGGSDGSAGHLGSLASIAHGSGVYFVAYVFARIAGFLLNVLLARLLGTTQYGFYAYANTLVSIFSRVTEAGTGPALLRYLPTSEIDVKQRITTLAYLTVVVVGLVVVVAIWIFASSISLFTLDDNLFVTVLKILSFLIPLDALIRVTSNAFRGLELPSYQLGISKVLRPLARLCGVAIAVFFGLPVVGVVTILILASLLTLMVAIVLLISRTYLVPRLNINRENASSFYSHAVPLSVADLGTILYRRVDLLMVGYFLAASSVGVYNIAIILTRFVTFPLSAVGQVFPAVASRAYQNDDHDELQLIYAVVTRWSFTGGALIAAATVVFRIELLSLFGEEFVVGQSVMIVYVIGQLANGLTGPSNYLLMMTDNQYIVLGNKLIFSIGNVGLNAYLIPKYGIVGAALATGFVFTVQSFAELVELWHFERFFPFQLKFLKPLVSVSLAAATMWLLRPLLDGLWGVIGGALIGAVVAGVVLIMSGVEEEDKKLLLRLI